MNKDFIYEEQKQLIEMWKNKYYEQKEKVEQLEKDNKDLDKENQILFETNLKLQNNRDKAIEYVEEKGRLKYNPNELINILKGDSDD